MDDLLLNSHTIKRVEDILAKPPQCLLIYGPAGSGKTTLAHLISSRLLQTGPDKLKNHPYFIHVARQDGKQDIPIDAVRGVIKYTSLRVATKSGRKVNRIVFIEEAHRMSSEAQNALLKIIEEPPAKTTFILTAWTDNSVLPTIASRAEKLSIRPVGLKNAIRFFSARFDETKIESAWRLSGGAAALMMAILTDDNAHPLKSAVEQAKRFLAADRYTRLLMLDSLSDDRAGFDEVLDALSRTLTALHHSAINQGNARQAGRLLKARKMVDSAQKSISNNTSRRLLAIDLAQQLPV